MTRSAQLFFAACLTILATASVTLGFERKVDGRVTEVAEGDLLTITTLDDKSRFVVRLLGIDAPELDQAVGQLARAHLARFAMGQVVTLGVTGFDSAGVVTGRVILSDQDLGAQMVRDGAAWVDTEGRAGVLDDDTLRLYQESERLAREERRGIWQEADPTPPWLHIKRKAEEAQNKEIREQQERAAAASRQAKSVRQDRERRETAPSPTSTPITLPAPGRGLTHVSAGARVPAGFVVVGVGRSAQRPGETVRAVKRAASGDAVCEGSPVPDEFLVTGDVVSEFCPTSSRFNNAMRIEEAGAIRRERVRQAIFALDRAIRMFQISRAGQEFDVKLRAAEPLAAQAVAVLPEGRLRANLAACIGALIDASAVRIARSGDYGARLSGDALLALAEKYNLNNVSEYSMDGRIVDAAVEYFNEAALEARSRGYIRLKGEVDGEP
jgi:endonuclease YncB( thermonuclease family)